jgi:hypothetical protein
MYDVKILKLLKIQTQKTKRKNKLEEMSGW